MYLGSVIVGMALVTFAVRFSFIGLAGRWSLPELVQRSLQFVPVAMLVAIIVPDLVFLQGSYALSLANGRVIAALVAALVAWKTNSVILTIVVGMLVLFGVQALSGFVG